MIAALFDIHGRAGACHAAVTQYWQTAGMNGRQGNGDEVARRREAISLFSRASSDEFAVLGESPFSDLAIQDLKPSEAGMIMLRGRMGGDGAPFNLGEATMARAVVEVAGRRGFGFRLGRDASLAGKAAIADALWQNPAFQNEIETRIMIPVRNRLAARKMMTASETAATRVDFFTLVRGE